MAYVVFTIETIAVTIMGIGVIRVNDAGASWSEIVEVLLEDLLKGGALVDVVMGEEVMGVAINVEFFSISPLYTDRIG